MGGSTGKDWSQLRPVLWNIVAKELLGVQYQEMGVGGPK